MTGVVEQAGAIVAPDRPSTAAAAAAVVAPTVRKANQPVQVPGDPTATADGAFTFILSDTVPTGTSTVSAPIDAAAVARNIAGPTSDGFHLRAARRYHLVAGFGGDPALPIVIGSPDAPCFPTVDGAVIDGPGSFTLNVNNTTGSPASLTTQYAAYPLSDL